jgi:hypothetical protein
MNRNPSRCCSPLFVLLVLSAGLSTLPSTCWAQITINIGPQASVPPHDVPQGNTASVQDIAIFAWQEFVALNWPALDPTTTGKRGRADTTQSFPNIKKGADGSFPLLVWQTYQHKNELFPAGGQTNPSFDSTVPVYKYTGPPISSGPSNPSFSLFANLDETSEIGLCVMYSHNTIRVAYEAKVNRALFNYCNTNGLTNPGGSYNNLTTARNNTKNNLQKFGGLATPAAVQEKSIICLPYGDNSIPGDAGEGTIEIKAAWRQLTPTEAASGRFYVRKVIFYTGTAFVNQKYNNAIWGLVALHIIHKTKSFPNFVFATWEQVDNFDDSNNSNTQDLKFVNTGTQLPNIPVIREHAIHSAIPPVNAAAHRAFGPNSIWQYYKLIGVQGTPINGPPPSNAPADTNSYYYLANIVVETNQTLQNFYGAAPNGVVVPAKNIYLNGNAASPFQMGGCMGCHGTQGQIIGGDMSRLVGVAPSNSNQPPESIDSSTEESLKSYVRRSLSAPSSR